MERPSPLHWGLRIERLAEAYLLARGPPIRVVARNLRFRCGEIDLVLEEERGDGALELVFVEVRARGAGAWVPGAESVDGRKRRKLERAISLFLARYHGRARTARLDVLAWDGRAWELRSNVWG
jgi:putative endonuclease